MIGLIPFGADEEDLSDFAIRLDERLEAIVEVAGALGIPVTVAPAEAIIRAYDEEDGAARAAFEAQLAGCHALWWFGCIVPRLTYERLVEALAAFAPKARVFDSPAAVEDTDNLSKTYGRLEGLPLRQPKTRFLPLSEADCEGDARALTARLSALLPRELPPEGLFLRTYYGTRKIHAGLNMASSREELVERAVDLVTHLRLRRSVGGLALRELLPITCVWDHTGYAMMLREFRVFVVDGEPALWTCDIELDGLRGSMNEADWEALGSLTPDQREGMLAAAREAGRRLGSRFFIFDVAEVEGGELVIVEVNPGYCSGWAHRIAYVAVYGQVLRMLAGQPRLRVEEVAQLADGLGISRWGEGLVYELLG